LPSKVTATELKGRAEADADAASVAPPARESRFRMPDFTRKDKPVSGAEKGTATHLVLQYMDFSRTGSEAEVRAEIERLRARRFLSDREAAAVDAGAIVALFASPLGERMCRAAELHREFKFSLLCPAEEIFGRAAGEEVLLQGVVDCYLVEDGGITVVDYKTDTLRTRVQALERAQSYAPQLNAYARALERIRGLPVRSCVLYFLSVGEAVSLPR
ncbi:MAG: PD-(D/E)XK nuclease family protein, partial [Oscillospiraceae bacterium]|nr:PD-(D/E)XK nuclease family protein [Oscillospiraceae bacterium]